MAAFATAVQRGGMRQPGPFAPEMMPVQQQQQQQQQQQPYGALTAPGGPMVPAGRDIVPTWVLDPNGTTMTPARPTAAPTMVMPGGMAQNWRGPDQWSVLERILADKLADVSITQEDVRMAQACLVELVRAVAPLGKNLRVRPFGSIANGFGRRGSDLDATCFQEKTEGNPSDGMDPSAHDLLERVVKLLEDHNDFTIIEEVKGARIPILQLKFKKIVDVDLSFQNTEPLPNTQLLRAYVALGGLRVRDLGVLVKLWAEAAGVCGATKSHLSAYALTLMAIYFLQVDPTICLHVLPTDIFHGEAGTPDQVHNYKWRCNFTLAELLSKFFNFFATNFQWGTEVVSVRVGRRLPATDPTYSNLRGHFTSRLHIEDPFLLERNLHCTLRQKQELDLYERICEAAQAMQQGYVPVGLRPAGDSAPRPRGGEANGGGVGMPGGAPATTAVVPAGNLATAMMPRLPGAQQQAQQPLPLQQGYPLNANAADFSSTGGQGQALGGPDSKSGNGMSPPSPGGAKAAATAPAAGKKSVPEPNKTASKGEGTAKAAPATANPSRDGKSAAKPGDDKDVAPPPEEDVPMTALMGKWKF